MTSGPNDRTFCYKLSRYQDIEAREFGMDLIAYFHGKNKKVKELRIDDEVISRDVSLSYIYKMNLPKDGKSMILVMTDNAHHPIIKCMPSLWEDTSLEERKRMFNLLDLFQTIR